MMMVVVEGDTDLPYMRKLLAEVGLLGATEIDAGGKGNIDRELPKYISIGRSMPMVVLRDLDHDAPCAAALVAELVPRRPRWFRLRLAVHELESWVLADAAGLSKLISVDEKWIPEDPDSEPDPTRSLLKVIERAPAHVRRRLLPARGSSVQVGPLYEATLIEFGAHVWSAARASKRSPSLKRARASLTTLAREWHAFVNAG
jgi:hypothetical protein